MIDNISKLIYNEGVRKVEPKKRRVKMTYRVIKMDSKTEKETNYGGGYTMEDVKAITKGYTFNGLYYDRKGSRYFFIVEEER